MPKKNNKNARANKRTTGTSSYQTLEDRRMLAVSVVQNADVLDIIGDSNANTVSVQRQGSVLRVTADSTYDFTYSSIATIRFFGGDGNDVFTSTANLNTVASGQGGRDTLTTGTGNDFLYGGDGIDTLSTVGGSNTLSGGEGNDQIDGGSGYDRIYGGNGDDTLNAYNGDDLINAGTGSDNVNAGSGNDTVYGYLGNDVIIGGHGNDLLFGQFGSNNIQGGVGNDVVRGGSVADVLRGNDGDDRVLGDGGADSLFGDAGMDVIFAGDGNDTVRGGDGNDRIFGGDGNDNLYGDDGNDNLRGNNGADNLYGGGQADRLAGDNGNDYLSGDQAGDKIFGDAGDDTVDADYSDTVKGGTGDDLLNLSAQNADVAVYDGDYGDFVVTLDDDMTLVVRDTTGTEGTDLITGAESLKFGDQTRTAFPEVTQRVYMQPIIVSNSNGSNTAEFFGNASQELEIKRQIDEIYLQAGVDVTWLTERSTNDTYFNVGNGGTRPQSDLDYVVDNGDANGVGHSDPLILDMYFVQTSAGFGVESNNVANGLAYVGGNGITMHTGDNLPTFSSGREVVAEVAAHEIAHNLGLSHISTHGNLMAHGRDLEAWQVTTILNSNYTQVI